MPCFHISLWLKGALEIGGGGATLYLCPTGHFGPKELAIWMEKKSHTALCSCMFLLEMGHFNGPSLDITHSSKSLKVGKALILTFQHDSSVLSFTLTSIRKSRKGSTTEPNLSLPCFCYGFLNKFNWIGWVSLTFWILQPRVC